MFLEPLLIFFLLRYLRRFLRKFSPDPQWDKILNFSSIAVIVLFVIGESIRANNMTWLWDLILLTVVWMTFKLPVFQNVQQIMYAVLPLVLLTIFNHICTQFFPSFYDRIDQYVNLAFGVAITWLISVWIKSGKQQKALDAERKKTREEEERRKFIAVQKDELEVLVNERTKELVQQKEELQQTLSELREAQAQLIQSEKMASLGELTAGIAHEIQNPLNFVNNFSDVNSELIGEMQIELQNGNVEEAIALANDIKENEQKINHHGKRADAIVKGMLQHSRKSSGQKEPTNVNALADEYLRLSYHGLRAKDKTFNATLETNFDESIEKINIIPQDIGRVLLNLFNNAFYAVNVRLNESSGQQQIKVNPESYKPTVSVSTKKCGDTIFISVSDNGCGIPQKVLDKIYQPFFTTKPTGEGTGLGLSLSYDIIKAHGGQIKVETSEGKGTEFIIQLPV
ncbi:MAG TPA: ATP-binding protein [Hanamia sp.]|nr:ATP-binding protein [Hanamia sp.]